MKSSKKNCITDSLLTLETVSGQPRISSAVIAEQIGIKHKALKNLVQKHRARLETFGELPFKKDVGVRDIPAYLNEDQAIFVLTLSRNTERVVTFKHRLVSQFSRLRKQAEKRAQVEWQQNRAIGKLIRHDLTDTVRQFVEYATAQGSNHAGRYYLNITKAINQALSITDRDTITEQELHLLQTAELIVKNTLNAGMADNLPYKTIRRSITNNLQQFVDSICMASGHG